MSIESNISDAINSLRLANEELLAKRDELIMPGKVANPQTGLRRVCWFI